MAGTLFRLTPEEALAGFTPSIQSVSNIKLHSTPSPQGEWWLRLIPSETNSPHP
jgi:hypothetical protein